MKGTNKVLSVLLAVLMMFSVIPITSIEAEAVSYNISAAVSFANSHWNDGIGLCAEFVSRCLNAGGVIIPNKASYYSSSTLSYKNNSGTLGVYTNPYTCSASLLLYLAEHYQIITNPSSSDIAVGDVVFMYGGSSGQWKDGHVGIVISKTNGVPVYAAHNRATNSGKFSSGYPCTYVAKMNGVNESHKVDANYGKNFTAYPKAKITASNIFDAYHNQISSTAWIGTSDKCTIHEVYTDGCCKVSYPLDDGGTKTVYSKISLFKTHNILSIRYDANGGKIDASNEKYYLNSSDVVYRSSTGKVFAQEMVEGTTYDSGLYNYTTFGITRKGYTFKGWGTTSSGGTVYSQSESMTAKKLCSTIGDGDKTITLYAIWAPNELSVYYNANGGKVSLENFTLNSGLIYKNSGKFVQTWQYNVAKDTGLVNPKSFGLARTGYTFMGWGTKSTGGTIFDQNDVTLLPTDIKAGIADGNCSRTLYAIWEAKTYTVKYDANGGTGTVSNSSHTYDTAKTLNANKFTRTGYTFLGWSTSSTATAARYTDKQSVKNLTATNGGTVTLYAVWSKNEHTPGAWSVVTPATCTSTGLSVLKCTTCGEVIAEKELAVAEHSVSDWKVITEATCITDGVRQKTCTVCNEIIYDEEIPATGHTAGDWEVVTEATCSTEGFKQQNCSVCKEVIDTQEIPVTDHVSGEWITSIEPTCEETGMKVQYCIYCDIGLANEEIPSTGHKYENGVCSGCGLLVSDFTGVYDDYFYKDGVMQRAYQLVEFEGNYYFINNGNKIAKNTRIYLGQTFVEGTSLTVGYYDFDADGKLVMKNGPDGDYFYRDGIQLKAYQLVEFEGDYYFINNGNKIAKNQRIYLGQTFVEGTSLAVGYYEFGADGKMAPMNGPVGDYFYKDGVRQNAYQLVEYEGNFYFVNDSHKLAKNKRIYLTERFTNGFTYSDGTPITPGYYDFDENGKMVFNGPIGDYFYKDGAILRAYQLVEYKGDFYFINDGHKLAKNKRIYLSQVFVEGTTLAVGYYEFGADGKMVALNGPVGDYFYKDGTMLKAYQLVEYNDDYYFINDSHKLAKNKTIYLSQTFVEGTGLEAGYYEFDANGKLIK